MRILIVDDAAVNLYILECRNDPALRGIPFVDACVRLFREKGFRFE